MVKMKHNVDKMKFELWTMLTESTSQHCWQHVTSNTQKT